MVKAAAGGGGKGMRVVREAGCAGELRWSGARSEALKAFGDASVYLEKFIERPRHVEIQVLADARAHHPSRASGSARSSAVTRSWWRRRPRWRVSADLRERMGAAAVAAAQAVGYRGAGTCEFLLHPDGSFYFLEMNTRIQVEHPVTELVYGVDLVREQLASRPGEPMQVPPRLAHPAGMGPRVPDHQRGSRQRVPALHRPDRISEAAGGPGGPVGQRDRDRVTRSRSTTTPARQADRVGAGPRRRRSPG